MWLRYKLAPYDVFVVLLLASPIKCMPEEKPKENEPTINVVTSGNNAPAVGKVEGDLTINLQLAPGDLQKALQGMSDLANRRSDEFSKEFPLGYALFTLAGDKNPVIPFQDTKGNEIVVYWGPAQFDT